MDNARTIQLVHTIPGRTRLRLSWLREAPQDAPALAERLLELPGMKQVRVRVRTGSVLCVYDAAMLAPEAIASALAQRAGAVALARGESPPVRPPVQHFSRIAARTAAVFHGLDRDLLRVTNGELDLGTAGTLTLLVAGGLEVLSRRELPSPPWFNLAWWAFRTFMTTEDEALRENGEGQGEEPIGS